MVGIEKKKKKKKKMIKARPKEKGGDNIVKQINLKNMSQNGRET